MVERTAIVAGGKFDAADYENDVDDDDCKDDYRRGEEAAAWGRE